MIINLICFNDFVVSCVRRVVGKESQGTVSGLLACHGS